MPSARDRLMQEAAAVKVQFKWWGVSRALTRDQKNQMAEQFQADAKVLTAGKKLIDPKCDTYAALSAIRGEVREYWTRCTLPYVEDGVRLLKRSRVEEFNLRMGQFRERLEAKARELQDALPELKGRMQTKLADLYKDDEYPDDVAGLFGLDWSYPNTAPPDYLGQINPELYEQERRRVQARFEEAAALAQEAMTQEFSKLVGHLAERLAPSATGEKKVFRDSAIGNLKEFFDRFKELNVEDESALAGLIDQAKALVSGTGAGELRKDQTARQELAEGMARIAQACDGLVVNKKRRVVKFLPREEVAHAG